MVEQTFETHNFAPKRRHHVLPGAYQRELSEAAARAGIAKRSNSHVLRHSYATHLLEDGSNIRTVQEFLGHQCVETTMIYLHVMEDQRESTRSPLDRMVERIGMAMGGGGCGEKRLEMVAV